MSERFTLARVAPGRLQARGRIDTANAAAVLREGERVITAADDIDLAGLASADSVTLAVLLAWAARPQVRGGVTFSALPPPLRALAHLSGVEALLENARGARAA